MLLDGNVELVIQSLRHAVPGRIACGHLDVVRALLLYLRRELAVEVVGAALVQRVIEDRARCLDAVVGIQLGQRRQVGIERLAQFVELERGHPEA